MYLRGAVEAASARGDVPDEITARVNLGEYYKELGHFCSAGDELEAAWGMAISTKSDLLMLRAQMALGLLDLVARRWDRADRNLRESLTHARRLGDKGAQARILAGQANLLLVRDRAIESSAFVSSRGLKIYDPPREPTAESWTEAQENFSEGIRLAKEAEEYSLEVQILLSQARTLLARGSLAPVASLAEQAWGLLQTNSSRCEPFLAASCGRLFADLAFGSGKEDSSFAELAVATCEFALQRSDHEDSRTRSYALGCLGSVAFRRGHLGSARSLTLKALDAARSAGIEEAQFEWTWQVAQILRSQGDTNHALDAYRQAISVLQPLRRDFLSTLVLGRPGRTFAESAGRVYYEWADLLIRRSRDDSPKEIRQGALADARRSIELLRASELEDFYLEEDCAGLVKASEKSLDDVADNAAVVYFIALEDRLELLVRLPSGLQAIPSRVSRRDLHRTVRNFREQLINDIDDDHVGSAGQLWTWLIQPILPVLKKEGIDTLLIVPDGELAAIPLAALRGPDGFLIKDFALAVSPGLSLMKAQPLRRSRLRPLLCGYSEGESPLPWVTNEVEKIGEIVAGGSRLMNSEFTIQALAREIERGRHSIIHIASHGYFGGNANQTFLVAAGGERLTLNQLEELILPRMVSPWPIEMLVLSACVTAAGDERAAFGLAGVAVKSGVRTAVASLWNVNDLSTSVLMVEFYRQLRADPKASRAQVLQRAQQALIRVDEFDDPYFWAPFILVGQWDESRNRDVRGEGRVREGH